MKKNYDFSNAVKNPYAKKLKKTICINISESVIAYFKALSEKTDIPYQVLINMFLAQAKAEKMEPRFIPKSRKKQVA
ncbi:MAG: antitoxin [Fibrobacter sp.]|jgi:predicted DNA binding CopG/RHH family protein|uniref:CopG family antitoxin n=1 Tax=unclassified Fibrobacter TaxID=2634177 RepID=UPI0025BA1518|nr:MULTISPECIES: antitoxin [unclassified Fibrobacter]MBQ9227073.1 antitoxin [Fibrobacter sp.]MBR1746296.1 antitoxin [Fibrobacter sp.]MBR2308442.1 antitoxin [Fibrobacter sp.]MBR4007968.1 antitoxin [Fibrobacter sp.]MBR6450020.1 antitoxin [Fibrobacter sp.]